jgi:hypothetical protein
MGLACNLAAAPLPSSRVLLAAMSRQHCVAGPAAEAWTSAILLGPWLRVCRLVQGTPTGRAPCWPCSARGRWRCQLRRCICMRVAAIICSASFVCVYGHCRCLLCLLFIGCAACNCRALMYLLTYGNSAGLVCCARHRGRAGQGPGVRACAGVTGMQQDTSCLKLKRGGRVCIKAAGVEPGGCVGLCLPCGGCRCWWQVWGRLRRPQGVVL